MTEKKMTRAQAIELMLDITADGFEAENVQEAREILTKMHEQLTKPRKKSDTPSKTRLINENLAAKCVEAMEGHDAVTGKWLMEHVNGLMTPQKTTAVMKIAIEDGRVIRVKEGKTISYSLAE